jgi:hypothetical protein
LDGSASNDPDGRIIGWQWAYISGPLFFGIVNANHPKSQLNNLSAGIYLFELKVTDNEGLSARDTVQISVMPLQIPGGSNIYIAGWGKNANDKSIARIWNNGILQNLSDGQNDACATAVFVSGTDVYVAGFDGFDAILWKNGVAQNLMRGGLDSTIDRGTWVMATSVYVSGSDVYVSGNIITFEHLGGFVEGVLWKNGVAQNLSAASNGSMANSVFVSGSGVYVAGMIFTSGNGPFTSVWKNGVAQNLGPYSGLDNGAKSVFVTEGDVYVTGELGTSATLWKNGMAQNLGASGNANSVFVSGSNVYVAGNKDGNATLWKNGIGQNLGSGSSNSVFVSGNDVNVVGKKDGIATLWKNAVAYTIQGLSEASSVFVK